MLWPEASLARSPVAPPFDHVARRKTFGTGMHAGWNEVGARSHLVNHARHKDVSSSTCICKWTRTSAHSTQLHSHTGEHSFYVITQMHLQLQLSHAHEHAHASAQTCAHSHSPRIHTRSHAHEHELIVMNTAVHTHTCARAVKGICSCGVACACMESSPRLRPHDVFCLGFSHQSCVHLQAQASVTESRSECIGTCRHTHEPFYGIASSAFASLCSHLESGSGAPSIVLCGW